jgi:hypothetical protein
MKRKEKEKEEQLALANTLSRIILTSPDIMEMGRECIFELKQLMPINWTTIGLIEESRGLMRAFHWMTHRPPGSFRTRKPCWSQTC